MAILNKNELWLNGKLLRNWWVIINRKPVRCYGFSYTQVFFKGKHLLQDAASFFLSQAVWLWKVKVCHLVTIISLSHLSVKLYQSTDLMSSSLLAKIGVSSSIHTSTANWFMGANRWTVFPSSNITNMPHRISSLVHLEPFRKMFSALSAATQPYVSLAEFENVWNIFSSSYSRNLLP